MRGSKRIDPNALRLLDANLNRCREGLRVLEDTARFILEDKKLFLSLRSERHLLDRLTRSFYPELVCSRNSDQDEGRKIVEGKRKDIQSIVAANFRRCGESLRVLEEYGKLFSERSASKFKKMRFKIYKLESENLEKITNN